jgi:hypothetical protein
MASTTETGHAINLANFEQLKHCVISFGNAYNPVPDKLKVANLNSVGASATSAFDTLNTLNGQYLITISSRENTFDAMRTILARVGKTAEVLGVNSTVLKALRELIRKLRGERAVAKKDQSAAVAEGETPIVYHSVSQLSFDQRIEHFSELVALLQAQVEYKPNETALTVQSLTALLLNMRATNTATVDAEILLNNARNTRNDILYAPENGLVNIALDVKKYVLAVFGANSNEYKTVKKISFRKIF